MGRKKRRKKRTQRKIFRLFGKTDFSHWKNPHVGERSIPGDRTVVTSENNKTYRL